MSDYVTGVRAGKLRFKGEQGTAASKHRTKKRKAQPTYIDASEAQETNLDDEQGNKKSTSSSNPTEEHEEVPLFKCEGRAVVSGTTIQGFETRFRDQVEVGDSILVHHPQSLTVSYKKLRILFLGRRENCD
jgi:hypothetical protein